MQFPPLAICDIDATRRIYAATIGDTCDCPLCRNIRAQFDQLPLSLRTTIQSLGIDFSKPVETIGYGKSDHGYVYEIEWPFIANVGTASSAGGHFTLLGHELRWDPGGIPSPDFDATQRRWSLGLLLRQVPWVLKEPEPSPQA